MIFSSPFIFPPFTKCVDSSFVKLLYLFLFREYSLYLYTWPFIFVDVTATPLAAPDSFPLAV